MADDLICRQDAKKAIHDTIVSGSTVCRVWDAIDGIPAANVPRLLTAEDFHGNPDLDDGGGLPAWKESRKATRRSGWAVICYGKWLADTAEPAGAYCAARYWTARPSDEQREATPWPT